MIKKYILGSVLTVALSISAFAQNLGTPVTISPTVGGLYPLLSQGAKVKYVSLSSSAAGIVTFYDSNSTNTLSTNGGVVYFGGISNIVPAYTTYTNYMTNTVATNFMGLAGVTNFYTNYNGIWTVSNTIPLSTNILRPLGSFAVGANSIGSYPVDWIATRGVIASLSTNSPVILYYLPE